MATQVKAVPDGFHTLTPHLTVKNADKALDFYQKALGAKVLHVSRMPDGKVMHATIQIGDSMLMLNDEFPEHGSFAPEQAVGFALHVYVDNVDDLFKQALAAGATQKMPLMDQFWGDRYGQVQDPFGFRWSLGQHIKDMSPEQMDAAGKEAMKQMAQKMPERKTA
jgi:PhnB protein